MKKTAEAQGLTTQIPSAGKFPATFPDPPPNVSGGQSIQRVFTVLHGYHAVKII